MDVRMEELLLWAQTMLATDIESALIIADTQYSFVLKLTTVTREVYYLKQTPPALYVEAKIIEFLNSTGSSGRVPRIVAASDAQNCFLMPSSGSQTLRTLFAGTLDKDLLQKALFTYTDIQRTSTHHIQTFVDLGVPDWRGAGLLKAYERFLGDEVRLKPWDMSKDQRRLGENSIIYFERLLNDVADLNLPAVLNHSDFHDNAMLFDASRNEITIIDWGEVIIGCPLMPLACCLGPYMRYRYAGLQQPGQYEEWRSLLLNVWSLEGEKAEAIFDLLATVNYILTYYELLTITNGILSPKWREYCKAHFFEFQEKLAQRYA